MTSEDVAQVHLYLPDRNHPAFGLVRAIVKDSTDNNTANYTNTWVDSGVWAPFALALCLISSNK